MEKKAIQNLDRLHINKIKEYKKEELILLPKEKLIETVFSLNANLKQQQIKIYNKNWIIRNYKLRLAKIIKQLDNMIRYKYSTK